MNTHTPVIRVASSCAIVLSLGFTAAPQANELHLVSAPDDPFVLGAQSDRNAFGCQLSGNGRYAVFGSDATNLIANDHNGTHDVFVKDRNTGAVERISRRSDGSESQDYSLQPSISDDGRYVAFASDDDLTGAGATTQQVYLADRQLGTITLVSHTAGGAPGNGSAYTPTIDATGAFIAFSSDSSNLVAGDSNGVGDVFRYEVATAAMVLVSTDSSGVQGDARSTYQRIAAGGDVIAFGSDATNLDGVDGNGFTDVYVKDLASGVTQRVSVSTTGGDADAVSYLVDLSADGGTVVFNSVATNLVASDGNGVNDVFARRLAAGITRRVSEPAAGGDTDAASRQGLVSGDGRYVAFPSLATNLAGPDPHGVDQVYVKDMQSGAIVRATDTTARILNLSSVSSDLTYLCFDALGDTLVADDTNGVQDVFVLDATTLAVTRVDLAETAHPVTAGDAPSYNPDISADGSRIVFDSSALLLDAEGYTSDNTYGDIFLYDTATSDITRLSNTPFGDGGNDASYGPQISADGRFVAFSSLATDLTFGGDGNDAADIFRVDTANGAVVLVSASMSSGGTTSDGAYDPSISDDGSRVAFTSGSADLVPGDTNNHSDAFVWSVVGGMQRVSVSSSGDEANFGVSNARISGDGNVVAFWSAATNLVAGDTNLNPDIFVHEIDSGVTERVSVAESGDEANDFSLLPAISQNGRFVAFLSYATNLVPNDLSPGLDVVLVDRSTGVVRLATADLAALGFVDAIIATPWLSPDGSIVLFGAITPNGVGALLRYRVNTDVLEIVQMGIAGSGNPSSWSEPVGYTASADGLTTVFGWAEPLVPEDNNGTYTDIYLLREDATDADSIFANGYEEVAP